MPLNCFFLPGAATVSTTYREGRATRHKRVCPHQEAKLSFCSCGTHLPCSSCYPTKPAPSFYCSPGMSLSMGGGLYHSHLTDTQWATKPAHGSSEGAQICPSARQESTSLYIGLSLREGPSQFYPLTFLPSPLPSLENPIQNLLLYSKPSCPVASLPNQETHLESHLFTRLLTSDGSESLWLGRAPCSQPCML